ncbi:MAG: cation transporter [Rhodospirillales bacterium]|nr:cation transporter [Rhodospirillales bacterium]
MPACCHDDRCSSGPQLNSPAWRRALWIALAVNAAMFLAEIIMGVAAGSAALLADAIDFFGDAANYAVSLGVAGMALVWRARAALVKGASLALFGLAVLAAAAWHADAGILPEAGVIGAVGILALAVNASVALMLYRFRGGDANMRSVWICSRNDAIGNVAVLAAAAGVFGTGTGWPDIIVASIMAGLGLWGGAQIVRQTTAELSLHAQRASRPSKAQLSARAGPRTVHRWHPADRRCRVPLSSSLIACGDVRTAENRGAAPNRRC